MHVLFHVWVSVYVYILVCVHFFSYLLILSIIVYVIFYLWCACLIVSTFIVLGLYKMCRPIIYVFMIVYVLVCLKQKCTQFIIVVYLPSGHLT